jgi:hypothetical protein
MKTLLALVFLIVFAEGCKKDSSGGITITGTWELRMTSGTIAGVTKTYPPGNGSLVQFNTNSTYKFFTNNQQSSQGTYKIVKNGATIGGQVYDGLLYDDRNPADFVVLKADSLTIGDTFPDGVTSSYVRQK